MESNLSCLSSLKNEDYIEDYIQPHYKESYRLAIYALLCGGKEAYEEFLRAEQLSHLLSEEEILFILKNAQPPEVEDDSEGKRVTDEVKPSTYFPMASDEEVPDLELGWPEVKLEGSDTSISMLFQPPRLNTPTIKEVVRKQIQEARQIIAIAMDVFTDVDIFKEIISATLRGLVVYILLDDSQFKSFHAMSHRVGVNIRDLKKMRVRTVQGLQYQCQSGMKFHGGLEQKFMLVDCRTVLHGTYSYTWSHEKINLSMALVVTGQLVSYYDEEFRRLYARSTVPPVLSRESSSVQYHRNTMGLQRSSSSQLSLQQIHMRSRVMHGIRTAQDDRFNNSAIMSRGLSVQDKLHQSHCPDMGSLVRGHSYGGELQKLNSMTRLRMGTKDLGIPVPPERTGYNMRGGGDLPVTNRLAQQQHRHQSRYGADQNMIPFNSETSLHRWKMDTYLTENYTPMDASCDGVSPVTSPYNSHTGLNEYQSQVVHSRSRDIKSRMEEKRQKRFSLQEFANLRQSQESLWSMYSVLERPKYMSSLRGLDMRESVAEQELSEPNGLSPELTNHKDTGPKKERSKREQPPTDGHRSVSRYDDKMGPDRQTQQTPDALFGTSAADLDMKLNDPSLKLSHLQASSLSIQQPRAMESLTEVPEEKENTHVNIWDTARSDRNEEIRKHEHSVPQENSVKLSLPAESQHQDRARGNQGSIVKVANSSDSVGRRETKKSVSNHTENIPNILNTSQQALETKSSHTEPTVQRKSSMRKKVQSMLSSDEKKATKKEKASVKSQNPSGSNQTLWADHSQTSLNGLSSPADTEKYKSPFQKLSPQRSSKRKTNSAAEPDQGSKSTLDSESTTVPQTMIDKAYSRYEYLLSSDKSSSLKRHDSDKKMGRFMQRMGNLIGKNK